MILITVVPECFKDNQYKSMEKWEIRPIIVIVSIIIISVCACVF